MSIVVNCIILFCYLFPWSVGGWLLTVWAGQYVEVELFLYSACSLHSFAISYVVLWIFQKSREVPGMVMIERFHRISNIAILMQHLLLNIPYDLVSIGKCVVIISIKTAWLFLPLNVKVNSPDSWDVTVHAVNDRFYLFVENVNWTVGLAMRGFVEAWTFACQLRRLILRVCFAVI